MTAPPRPDIRRPDAVNADWLTAVLQEGGVDAVVKGFSAANVGTGQLGEASASRWTMLARPPTPRPLW
jgi:hypothetical protein